MDEETTPRVITAKTKATVVNAGVPLGGEHPCVHGVQFVEEARHGPLTPNGVEDHDSTVHRAHARGNVVDLKAWILTRNGSHDNTSFSELIHQRRSQCGDPPLPWIVTRVDCESWHQLEIRAEDGVTHLTKPRTDDDACAFLNRNIRRNRLAFLGSPWRWSLSKAVAEARVLMGRMAPRAQTADRAQRSGDVRS